MLVLVLVLVGGGSQHSRSSVSGRLAGSCSRRADGLLRSDPAPHVRREETMLPPDYQRVLAVVREAAGPVMARQVGEVLGGASMFFVKRVVRFGSRFDLLRGA
ncbi:hypothetical protein [Streptomyces sp. NPDC088254]|uniref:hypothetical protein n=1 Tax=Streptomyces sp. NPDC088254 TaxID=3365847 RepID=UPI003826396F